MKGTAILLVALLVGLLIAAGCVTAPTTPAPAQNNTTKTANVTLPLTKPMYVIGIDGNYPPFTFQGNDSKFTGLDIEAARWIADRERFDVEFVALPWDGILNALQSGSIDMVYSGLTVTDERQKQFYLTTPYFTVNQSIAVRQDSNLTMQDLYDGWLRVGVQAGSTSETWVRTALMRPGTMPALKLYTYPDVGMLTTALENREIDASIVHTPVQKYVIYGRPLVIIGEIPTMEQYAVAIRKTDPELRAVMDDGLRQLMNDHYWQQLLRKYQLE
ncbi:MAG: ABC transporter substrate-binding protein [Methanoregulaceae archaeon]|nr:ABC transporter substrate-binding protein [Methanoregulaceae archaeon]